MHICAVNHGICSGKSGAKCCVCGDYGLRNVHRARPSAPCRRCKQLWHGQSRLCRVHQTPQTHLGPAVCLHQFLRAAGTAPTPSHENAATGHKYGAVGVVFLVILGKSLYLYLYVLPGVFIWSQPRVHTSPESSPRRASRWSSFERSRQTGCAHRLSPSR